MVGIMVSGYLSSTQKKEVAQAKVQDAKPDLNAAQKDTNAVVQIVTPELNHDTDRLEIFIK